jgi:hypothetical protein
VVNQIVSTQNPNTLATTFVGGPLPEAAALACAAGGTVLAVKCPLTTKGLATAVTAAPTNAGTCVVTTTLDATNGAWDDFNFKVVCQTAGTVGVAPGPSIQVSVDAGRNFGPAISLGAATTYAVSKSGVTLNFTGVPMVVADAYTFHTIGPKIQNTDIQAAINALVGSQYGAIGWGSTHLVSNGNAIGSGPTPTFTGGYLAADATTIEGYLDSAATKYTFLRLMLPLRDASMPAIYGGSAETDVAWSSALATDVGANAGNDPRVMAVGGFYNIPTAIGSNVSFGSPSYRRPAAWALAARTVAIPSQRMQSRVRDGSLTQIVINASADPLDGFVYHDDGSNGPLDTARICALRTRRGKGGLFVSHPNLLSQLGSTYNWWPKGAVIDIAEFLVHQLADDFIDADVRVNPNGTLYINDVNQIQDHIGKGVDAVLLSQGMVSGPTLVVVDQTANVTATSKVPVTVTVFGRGYIDEIDATVGFNNVLALG